MQITRAESWLPRQQNQAVRLNSIFKGKKEIKQKADSSKL